ncbi:sulfatase [Paenibacillus allorhizosphaerae]|uniref:Ulvan-active sulfatase n=1 Tax=Paenibacillus allorhizosphaerae TaxID=2849866 RepID=A0ABM8V9Q6_9BACL|nr:sulfatase [Paenibacillus allorhizosphaerae]CAG7613989.1 Ulvan-active sulfatase [Paenibacillus allorhizosphaerae]
MTRTNILLITADDLNYNSPGVAGCGIPGITPNIDRLAQEGIRFVHAHMTIAVCQPSRSVLMTGKYPHRNGALGFGPINRDVVTLQELLKKAGYRNGIIGKETHLAPSDKFYWDAYVRTEDEANGYGRDPSVYYRYTKQFIEDAVREGEPFCLMANSHDPHRPFAGSEQEFKKFGRHTEVTRRFAPDEIEVPGFLPDLPDVRIELAQYFASVHRCDCTVGEIVRALKESGQEDNTLVMFLSDNGMAFPFAKTNCYLTSTRTPWIARWPGKIEPGTVDEQHFISGIDFMPTILQAVGLSKAGGVDGRSFADLLFGKTQPYRTKVFTVFNQTSGKRDYPMRCVQNKQFGYIYNDWSDQENVFVNESQNGMSFKAMQKAAELDESVAARVRFFQYREKEELYDFEKDPDALNNLIDLPDYKCIVNDMRQELLYAMSSTYDPVTESYRKFLSQSKS